MMPGHTRLEVDRSYTPMVRRLTDGHSGAAVVLIDLLSRGRKIGMPVGEDTAWCLTMLSALGIYGADLHVLWHEVCGHSTEQMLTLLRACHEGCHGVSRDTIMHAIACCSQEAPLKELQLVLEVSSL